MPPLKHCTGVCGRSLHATPENFYRNKSNRNGLRSECRDCYKELERAGTKENRRVTAVARYKANPTPEKRRRYSWAARNPDKIKAKHHRRRARFNEAPGTFTAADIHTQYQKQKGLCHWCETPLEKYHVDHVIPLSKGGTNYPSNIVCACPTCNLKKSNKAPDVFRALLKGSIRANV